MSEEELERMCKELVELRNSQRGRTLTSIRPTGSASITNISGGVVGMDFASLYPSTMTMKFSSKQSRRKKKIKNIFNL
jgi:hypothetical protein